MRDNARTESVEDIRASSVKQQPTSPSTHEYERAMLTARSYSLGWGGARHRFGLLRLADVVFVFSGRCGRFATAARCHLETKASNGYGSRESDDSPLPQHCCCDK